MTHHFDPSDILAEDLTGVLDLAGISDEDGIVWDATASRFVVGSPAGGVPAGFVDLIVVEAGAQSTATDDGGGIAITWRWGIDGSGDPYFDAAGVTTGEEAVLALDPTTGTYSLVSVTA